MARFQILPVISLALQMHVIRILIVFEGQFGTDPNCKWRPWCYTSRVSNAKKVASFKIKLGKNSKCAAATNRSKVTQYIVSMKCRQEFEPPIGVLCDRDN